MTPSVELNQIRTLLQQQLLSVLRLSPQGEALARMSPLTPETHHFEVDGEQEERLLEIALEVAKLCKLQLTVVPSSAGEVIVLMRVEARGRPKAKEGGLDMMALAKKSSRMMQQTKAHAPHAAEQKFEIWCEGCESMTVHKVTHIHGETAFECALCGASPVETK